MPGNFLQKRFVAHHIKKCHLKLFEFKCEACGQSFFSKTNLVNHKRHCRTTKYKCSICKKVVGDLSEHLKVHVKAERLLSCHLCQKEFKSSKLHEDHLKRHHNHRSEF